MYVNITLFNNHDKEIKTYEIAENINIHKFLKSNHIYAVDINLKRFLKDINKAFKRNFKSLLFIDDSTDLVEVLTEEARELGHYAEGFTSSDAGYERYTTNQELFDIIVLDYKMPVLDGSRVADAIFEINKDARIVLLTGAPDLKPETIKEIPIIYKPSGIKDIIEASNVYDYQHKFPTLKNK